MLLRSFLLTSVVHDGYRIPRLVSHRVAPFTGYRRVEPTMLNATPTIERIFGKVFRRHLHEISTRRTYGVQRIRRTGSSRPNRFTLHSSVLAHVLFLISFRTSFAERFLSRSDLTCSRAPVSVCIKDEYSTLDGVSSCRPPCRTAFHSTSSSSRRQ